MKRVSDSMTVVNTLNQSFEQFNFSDPLLFSIKNLGFSTPTNIQHKSIRPILEGHDIVGEAKTGSGKTAAFGLPVVEQIANRPKKSRKSLIALVLTPTRELCVQVAEHFQSFAAFTDISVGTIYGGVSYRPQLKALRKSEIIVATPGRLIDLIKKKKANFKHLEYLIIDEADRMFDMGFREDLKFIIKCTCAKNRQTMLFSATMPKKILKFIRPYQKKGAKLIRVDPVVSAEYLKQFAYRARNHQTKYKLLTYKLIKMEEENKKGLVFCRTRRTVKKLATRLKKHGFNAIMMQGGMSQARRRKAMDKFKSQKGVILVATNIAARGLDFNIHLVVNYSAPDEADEYIHRIGRTARAGKSGEAWLILTKSEHKKLKSTLGKKSYSTIQIKPTPKDLHKVIHRFNSQPQPKRPRSSKKSSRNRKNKYYRNKTRKKAKKQQNRKKHSRNRSKYH